jgi:hypothetical protein
LKLFYKGNLSEDDHFMSKHVAWLSYSDVSYNIVAGLLG